MINYVMTAVKRTTEIKGRSSRSEYWWSQLAYIIFYIISVAISQLLVQSQPTALMFLAVGSSLFTLVASVTITCTLIRRLHDVNKSGWWMLLSLIPLVGFYVLYLICLPSDPGANSFGAPHKYNF